MRKIYMVTVPIALSLATSFCSYAKPQETEVAQEEEVLQETEPSSAVEDMDGNNEEAVDNMNDESGDIPETSPAHTDLVVPEEPEGVDGTYHGYATYEEYIDSKRQETLSPEQESRGYKIINGIVYSPAELYGDTSDTYVGGVMPSDKTGYATIKFETPPRMHGDISVGLMSLDNFKTYSTILYEIDDYKGSITLPDGTYTVDYASKVGDVSGQYYAYHDNFEVIAGRRTDCNFTLLDKSESQPQTGYNPQYDGSVNVSESMAAIESSHAEEAKERMEAETAKTEAKKNRGSVFRIVLTILTLGGLLASYIYLTIKKRSNRKGFY